MGVRLSCVAEIAHGCICYEDKKIKETEPSAPKHNYSCCHKKIQEVFESLQSMLLPKRKKRKITEWDLNQGPPALNK